MQIQRYLAIDKTRVDWFGEHYERHKWDFDWYIGDNKLGIIGNPSTEAEFFIGGILVADDSLIITPSQKNPRIQRANERLAVMRGEEGGIEEIYELIKLIQGKDVTHLYLSSSNPEDDSRILTFSPIEPSKALYKKGKILSVKINEDALKREAELEQILAKMHQAK